MKCLDCGKPKSPKGNYCKKCGYKYRKRPSGLKYTLHKINPTSFKKGSAPWNKNLKGWNSGEANPAWKGDQVGYWGLHDWVNSRKGKALICEQCGSKNTVQWANKSHQYKRDLEDWLALCRKCHHKFDNISKKLWKKRKQYSASAVQAS